MIPTFNRSHLLRRAVDSALQQTVRPAEIIVVDDGSIDDTSELCRHYGNAINYVRQANAGAAAARNSGIRVARHSWVAFLDSDDYWIPAHLERMEAAIDRTGGEARFYFCDMVLPTVGDSATLWEAIGFRPKRPFHFTNDGTAWMLPRRQPAQLQCSVFKAAALKECGGFDTRYRVTEDVDLFCRLGINAPVCAVDGVGCVQTSDDDPQNRLSTAADVGTLTHWRCNVMLWKSVLGRPPKLEPAYRRLVRFNLADTYLRLSRSLWRSGKVLSGAWHFMLFLAACEPALIRWLIRHRTVRGWEQQVRPTCLESSTVV